MKLLLYCTKGKPYLNDCKLTSHNKRYFISNKGLWSVNLSTQETYSVLNGKIVAECDFEVSKIESHQAYYSYYGPAYFTKRKEPFKYFSYLDLLEASCLRDDEIFNYLGNNGGYAIHIKNLHIFDEPRELDYYYAKSKQGCVYMLNKAPQNMMYVFDGDEKKVLISIRPQWLCKILNGEKTIEVRKKVLKEMLKND